MLKSLKTFIQIHRSIKQHATLFSLIVVLFIFGLFLEAYMHDFNLVYITLFFVFSFAFSAGPIGVLNLGHLKSTFEPSGRLFTNQEGVISVKITNTSNTTSWSVILYGEDSSINIPKVKEDSSLVVQLPYIPKKRGFFNYENCYLESKYPLSTARLTLPIKETYRGLVFPEPKGITLKSFLNNEEKYYGEEKEFDGLKEYDGTQNITHIHWASVAKGELSVKHFTKETETQNLLFDFYRAGSNDEARLSQLCLWVLECEKKYLAFKIDMPKQQLDSKKENTDEILEKLAKY